MPSIPKNTIRVSKARKLQNESTTYVEYPNSSPQTTAQQKISLYQGQVCSNSIHSICISRNRWVIYLIIPLVPDTNSEENQKRWLSCFFNNFGNGLREMKWPCWDKLFLNFKWHMSSITLWRAWLSHYLFLNLRCFFSLLVTADYLVLKLIKKLGWIEEILIISPYIDTWSPLYLDLYSFHFLFLFSLHSSM